MPILKKPSRPAQQTIVEQPRPEPQAISIHRPSDGSSMVLAQLAGQNAAIAQMLESMTGKRVVEATVMRDERGLIQKISMVVEPV